MNSISSWFLVDIWFCELDEKYELDTIDPRKHISDKRKYFTKYFRKYFLRMLDFEGSKYY